MSYQQPATPTVRIIAPDSVVPPHRAADASGPHDRGSVEVVRPESLTDVSATRHRAFDVLSGIAYAFDATMSHVDERPRFILTPAGTPM